MAGLCESGNEPPDSLKAITFQSSSTQDQGRLCSQSRLTVILNSTELLHITQARCISYDAPCLLQLHHHHIDRWGKKLRITRNQGKPRKKPQPGNLPDRDSNPGHLFSRPDALTVTPQNLNLHPCFFRRPFESLKYYIRSRIEIKRVRSSAGSFRGGLGLGEDWRACRQSYK
ncbi:hypothetical protein ANN_23289 [Periplaneta americana]|uniref:Uncharacterized protein n=1 Tax=Periplaneta americana TaxID=6978 RepID=A0ABQ8SLX2_PERAM|nr:hypothetical protein ANN_23289 [Periplaneta americana]